MGVFNEVSRRLDPTKIRVTGGDLPVGDYIFNGHAMIHIPDEKTEDETEARPRSIIELANKVRIVAKHAEDMHPVLQSASNMAPLYGTIVGWQFIGGTLGMLGGFAAGTLVNRNRAEFAGELSDGRTFNAVAEYRIYKRLQEIALP